MNLGCRAFASQSRMVRSYWSTVMPLLASAIRPSNCFSLRIRPCMSLAISALNAGLLRHSGCCGAAARTWSSRKKNWKYSGCSLHSVPSLSNTATRSSGGTKPGEPGRVTSATNFSSAWRAAPSRHDGSAAAAACTDGAAASCAAGAVAEVEQPTSARPASASAAMALRVWLTRIAGGAAMVMLLAPVACCPAGKKPGSRAALARCRVGRPGHRHRRPPLHFGPAAFVHHQAEAEVRHAVEGIGAAPCAGAVAQAEVLVAQERAAARDALGRVDRHPRFGRIPRCQRAHRVFDRLRLAGLAPELVGAVPVRDPLPGIAGHVGKAVAIGRKGADRAGAQRPAGLGTDHGERLVLLSLPDIGHLPAVGGKLLAPGIGRLLEPAARGELPFRLGRQPLAGPLGIGLCVFVRNLHHRVVVLALDRAARAGRMAPVGAGHIAPPARIVLQRHRARRADEDHAARDHGAVGRARRAGRQLHAQGFPVGRALGGGDITGGFDELAELRVGDVVLVHPEPMHAHLVRRLFIGLRHLAVAAHQEVASRHAHHAGGTRLAIADDNCRRGRDPSLQIPVAAAKAGRESDAEQARQQPRPPAAAPCGRQGRGACTGIAAITWSAHSYCLCMQNTAPISENNDLRWVRQSEVSFL
ncbi:protein of unknown function [Cupriavidus taiwanensis]|nr:protein of unknown function [Cupriavidus taiwanensis]